MPGSELEDSIMKERLRQVEEAILNHGADLQHLHLQVKEMQNMLIKIAANQQQLAERVSMWPFIKVNNNKKRGPPKSIDE